MLERRERLERLESSTGHTGPTSGAQAGRPGNTFIVVPAVILISQISATKYQHTSRHCPGHSADLTSQDTLDICVVSTQDDMSSVECRGICSVSIHGYM